MTNQHPTLPTQDQLAEWELQYFGGEEESFEVMMIKAFQAGADKQLEQVIEWLNAAISDQCIWPHQIDALPRRLQKAMRPQQQEDN